LGAACPRPSIAVVKFNGTKPAFQSLSAKKFGNTHAWLLSECGENNYVTAEIFRFTTTRRKAMFASVRK
jgi:hypothetical protein